MTLLALLVALLLVFLAFRFVKGMIKFAVLAAIVVLGLFFVHQSGAF